MDEVMQSIAARFFTMQADRFEYKQRQYLYANVRHIGWLSTHTSVYVQHYGSRFHEDAWLDVYIADANKPLRFRAGHDILPLFRNSLLDSMILSAAHSRLASLTFPYRISSYADELTSAGYFSFDGWRFGSDGHVTRVGRSSPSFSIERDDISITSRNPFELVLSKRSGNRLQALASQLTRQKISLRIDRDVFFELFKSLYSTEPRQARE